MPRGWEVNRGPGVTAYHRVYEWLSHLPPADCTGIKIHIKRYFMDVDVLWQAVDELVKSGNIWE